MRASPIHHLAAFVSFTLSAWALPPAPGTYVPPPPTHAEIWTAASAVVYGRILRVEVDATSEYSEHHNSTLRIERCWKGELSGDIRIEGPMSFDCYPTPFQFRRTYLIFLTRSPNGKAFLPHRVYNLSYPLSTFQQQTNFAQLFGDPPGGPDVDLYAMEMLEFIERTTGNTTEADSLLALIEPYQLERQNRVLEEQQRKAQAFLDQSLGFFASARKEPRVKTRKILLEKLQARLSADSSDERIKKLKDEITAELSIVETYLNNGIRDFPSNTSVYIAPPSG